MNNHNVSTGHTNNSQKMGSRRIFTPQFKLQVLESYRNDNDCKGNQRATARKYNIHRRQIQKWLQCESNLRSSVASSNQSNIKHQFNNINHYQDQQQNPRQPLQMTIATTNKNYFFDHHHSHQHQLPSEEVRENAVFNSIAVSTMRAEVDSSTNITTTVLEVPTSTNSAAVLVAAAASGIPNTSVAKSSTIISPLCPTPMCSSSASIITQPMIHPHHPYYSMPYTHTSANSAPVSVSVPVLSRHIPPQDHHPYSYNRHNIPSHPHAYPQAPPHSQNALIFVPSESLSVNVLSASTATATDFTITASAPKQRAGNAPGNGGKNNDGLRELPSIMALSTPARTKTISSKHLAENTNVNTMDYRYGFTESGNGSKQNNKDYKGKYQFLNMHRISSIGAMIMPMDLSRNSRHEYTAKISSDKVCKADNIVASVSNEKLAKEITTNESVVDLTFKKRRVVAITKDVETIPEKISRFSFITPETEMDQEAFIRIESNPSIEKSENEADIYIDVDVEVAIEEKCAQAKPVKLFKPYLLENDDNKDDADLTCSKFNCIEQQEPIIWSNHPGCLSPYSFDSLHGSSRGSYFQSPTVEKYTFPEGNCSQSGNKPLSSQSALSPTSTSALSPIRFLFPKGSPVSGYESSSSTYSEPTYRSENEIITITNSKSYCVELQMHAVCKNYMTPTCQSDVQRWLSQDTNITTNPTAAKTSNIFYA